MRNISLFLLLALSINKNEAFFTHQVCHRKNPKPSPSRRTVFRQTFNVQNLDHQTFSPMKKMYRAQMKLGRFLKDSRTNLRRMLLVLLLPLILRGSIANAAADKALETVRPNTKVERLITSATSIVKKIKERKRTVAIVALGTSALFFMYETRGKNDHDYKAVNGVTPDSAAATIPPPSPPTNEMNETVEEEELEEETIESKTQDTTSVADSINDSATENVPKSNIIQFLDLIGNNPDVFFSFLGTSFALFVSDNVILSFFLGLWTLNIFQEPKEDFDDGDDDDDFFDEKEEEIEAEMEMEAVTVASITETSLSFQERLLKARLEMESKSKTTIAMEENVDTTDTEMKEEEEEELSLEEAAFRVVKDLGMLDQTETEQWQ